MLLTRSLFPGYALKFRVDLCQSRPSRQERRKPSSPSLALTANVLCSSVVFRGFSKVGGGKENKEETCTWDGNENCREECIREDTRTQFLPDVYARDGRLNSEFNFTSLDGLHNTNISHYFKCSM